MGKRIVVGLEPDYHLVLHLMVAGRLRWSEEWWTIPAKRGLAALAGLDPGGIEVLQAPLATFREALLRERHTLKRALTDPHAFSGIGGAYADEILHRARLSPLAMNTELDEEEVARLWAAARAVLAEWVAIRLEEAGDRFPEKLTAFHPRMAVHGKYRAPCPACSTSVQRIVYAERETNYCPRCQTDGRVLADRALSRILKEDWPRTIEGWEEKPGLGRRS